MTSTSSPGPAPQRSPAPQQSPASHLEAPAAPAVREAFSFDGAPIAFVPGQSVGAALWAAGIRSWRTTRGSGRPRSLFCGIGVCFDCLLVVDGLADQRACLTPATAGTQVGTQTGSGRADLAV